MKRIFFFTALLGFTLSAFGSGVKIVSKTEDLSGNAGGDMKSEMLLQGDYLKFSSEDNGEMDFIYHAGKDKFWMVDHDKKQYTVLTRDDLERLNAQMTQALKQMEKQMANMPEEQRKQMEAMMEKQMETLKNSTEQEELTYKATGKGQQVNGWECDGYKGFDEEEELREELWTSSTVDLGVEEEDLSVLYDFMDFFSVLAKGLDNVLPLVGADTPESGEHSDAQYEGFPVKRTFYEDGNKQTRTEVINIEQTQIPEKAFEVPENYKEEQLQAAPTGRR